MGYIKNGLLLNLVVFEKRQLLHVTLEAPWYPASRLVSIRFAGNLRDELSRSFLVVVILVVITALRIVTLDNFVHSLQRVGLR